MPDDLNAAISSAVAESTKEAGGESTPAPDPTPASSPTPEPAAPAPEAAKPEAAKPEPPPTEEADEFWTPTADELAAIDKNPELKKVYRSMQRGMTQKAQTLAQERKRLENQAAVVEWIQRDPANAIRAIAAASNVDLGGPGPKPTETKVADSLEAKWAETVGPDAAKILRPLFEETARTILAQEVAPYKEQTEQLAKAAVQRGIAASVAEFGATVSSRGEEWDDATQAEMAKLAQIVEPGANTPINEYLGVLYDTVMANRMRTKSARSNLERLRRVRTEAEPANTARTSPAAEEKIDTSMSDRDAVAVAVRLAKQSLNIR